MPAHDFTFHLIVSTLENETRLGRVLFHPELSACEQEEDQVRSDLWELAAAETGELPLLEWHRRRAAAAPESRDVEIEIEPPGHEAAWELPVHLRFQAVCWRHGEAAMVAYVPALNIEVVAKNEEELSRRLPEEIRSALMRTQGNRSLRELAWLGRWQSVAVESVCWTIDVPTPKQVAQQKLAVSPPSVLGEVATDLSRGPAEVFLLDEVVLRLADWLWGAAPRSVLLVGPSGAGKTAAVRKLAAGSAAAKVWSTSGARIVAGMCGFGMWQERCQALSAELARTKATLHLGNLVELMNVGQSVHNDQGVGDFLRSSIARGDFLAIAECTPEQLAIIERDTPNILEAFSRMDFDEPSPQTGRAILDAAVRAWERKTTFEAAAIDAIDRLHRRYATYSAYPGRPLRFLKNLLADNAGRPDRHSITTADVTAAFSRETGLPLLLLEPNARLDLEATHRWFTSRVMGQEAAVRTIVDLLATVKAGLARPGRPLASLLFIGPTGVGKTEAAKALAEFLYRDRQRMTRIDMSEYADPLAADRLIGGPGGEGLLTAKIREQPFGVVLLDEFEKAHPRLFDLLLQVLGEGRLTDASGRLADFRNAVIIMTSNLGVESFGRQAPGFGQPDWTAQTQRHFAREAERFLRPEMFNRIDRVVTFLPLEADTLRQIARRELQLFQQREGIRYRGLAADFTDSVVEEIVRLGYEPRYGARPIKRAIERHLLAPLAARLNEYAADIPLKVDVASSEERIHVHVRATKPEDAAPREAATNQIFPATGQRSEAVSLQGLARQCLDMRRLAENTGRSEPLVDLRNELFRLERAEKRLRKQQDANRSSLHRALQAAERRGQGLGGQFAARLELVRGLVRRCDDVCRGIVAVEEPVLLSCYGGGACDTVQANRDLEARRNDLNSLRMDVFALQFDKPDYVTLAIYGAENRWLMELAEAYHRVFAEQGKVHAWQLASYGDADPADTRRIPLGDRESPDEKKRQQANGTRLQAEPLDDWSFYASPPPAALRGVALCLESRLAWPRWSVESGLHELVDEPGRRGVCLVHASAARIADYQPPEKADRKEGIAGQDMRRVYHRPRKTIDDRISHQRQRWPGPAATVIDSLAGERLLKQIDEHFRL